MKLEEAIEILEKERKEHHSFFTDIIGQAEALGIEALKAVRSARRGSFDYYSELLTGETED